MAERGREAVPADGRAPREPAGPAGTAAGRLLAIQVYNQISDSGLSRLPADRYRVDANSDRGNVVIRNVTETEDAAFAVQAISGGGDVLVEGRE